MDDGEKYITNTAKPPMVVWLQNQQSLDDEQWQDDNATKNWNSIPRRSEVAELLRLVDEAIIGTPTPAERRLQTYANKLRKEWKL